MYEDKFISEREFSWFTRSRVPEISIEAQEIIGAVKINMPLFLFVKKSDATGSDFYYLGRLRVVDKEEKTITNEKGEHLPIMNFSMKISQPVPEELYRYFQE
jgi:hypothetical protein